MLHAKFQNHRPSDSGEENFLKVFAIYSHGDHLGHVTLTIYIYFCSSIQRILGQNQINGNNNGHHFFVSDFIDWIELIR